MTRFRVTFLPGSREVWVSDQSTLLEAAQLADVQVNAVCGGQQVCGKCKVNIIRGNVRTFSRGEPLSEEEDGAAVLACGSKPLSDLTVEIPIESRIDGYQIVVNHEVLSERAEAVFREPLVLKHYLELPEPTLQDTLPDTTRLTREAKRFLGDSLEVPSLSVIRDLPETLRAQSWRVTATVANLGDAKRLLRVESGNTTQKNYGVAVDVGTTTLVVYLVDLTTGRVLDKQATHNPQVNFGEDVISRLIFASKRGGRTKLQKEVVGAINQLMERAARNSGISVNDVMAVVSAGNTTMTHLLLNLKPDYIRKEPYVPAAQQIPPIAAAEIGLQVGQNALLYCVPGVSSYVGGDVVAGVMASGMANSPKLSMLIDVGTNGEMAIGNNEWLVCCAASAGPAFEGGEVKFGMRATTGAIERVSLDDGGETVHFSAVGDIPPAGICGSGLLDLMAELLRERVIDRSGRFVDNSDCSRLRENEQGREFVVAYAGETSVGRDIVFSQEDISHLMRSKAAVYAGASVLLKSTGHSFTDLDRLFIAGGFGNYLNIDRGVAIGLLPDLPRERIKFIGNSAINGAKLVLLNAGLLREAEDTARKMTYFELSTDTRFMDEYVSAMFLPHTELAAFPSVV